MGGTKPSACNRCKSLKAYRFSQMGLSAMSGYMTAWRPRIVYVRGFVQHSLTKDLTLEIFVALTGDTVFSSVQLCFRVSCSVYIHVIVYIYRVYASWQPEHYTIMVVCNVQYICILCVLVCSVYLYSAARDCVLVCSVHLYSAARDCVLVCSVRDALYSDCSSLMAEWLIHVYRNECNPLSQFTWYGWQRRCWVLLTHYMFWTTSVTCYFHMLCTCIRHRYYVHAHFGFNSLARPARPMQLLVANYHQVGCSGQTGFCWFLNTGHNQRFLLWLADDSWLSFSQ